MYTHSTLSYLARNAFLCSIAVLVFTGENAVSDPVGHSRIVKGGPEKIEDARFAVQIADVYGLQFCGGSLISEQFVVTAAHCLYSNFPRNTIVIAGTEQRGNISSGTVAKISEMYIHPGYAGTAKPTQMLHPELYALNLHMDVAVLKLSEPIAFGNTIDKINMCDTAVEPGNEINIYGWGTTTFEGVSSEVLLTVQVPVKKQDVCIDMHKDSKTKISSSMVCAGRENGEDACSGDSGGPAVRKGELCGIVSWGVGCGHKTHVGVYTSIPVVRDFIDDAVNGRIKPTKTLS